MKKRILKLTSGLIPSKKHRKKFRDRYLSDPATRSIPLDDSEKAKILSLKNQHKGKCFYLFGGAPSLKLLDLSFLNNKEDAIVLTCNRGYHLKELGLLHSNYHFIADYAFFDNFQDEIDFAFMENLITENTQESKQTHFDKMYRYHAKKVYINDKWIDRDLFSFNLDEYVASSRTIIAVMLQFALYMGASEIILLGVDLSFNTEDNHFYISSESENQRTEHHSMLFKQEMYRWLENAYTVLLNQGVVVLNGSPIEDSLPFMEKVVVGK